MEHIYRLLELPEERWPFYAYFDPLWARAYVLAVDLMLSEEEVYRRIEQDGETLTGTGGQGEERRAQLFTEYLQLYAVLGDSPRQTDFDDHLAHYVTSQHHQCVFCSGPFPTDKWMLADVRSDITVMNMAEAMTAYLAERTATPTFRARTEKNKPQPYGIYLAREATETLPQRPRGADCRVRPLSGGAYGK